MIAALLLALAVSSTPPSADSPRERLSQAKTWVYQLQRVDLTQLAAAEADVVVLDVARDDGTHWTKDELELVRTRPNGAPRLVLGYVSIGEAEDYRPYWRPEWRRRRPPFVGRTNPAWPGNYPARFWTPEWREIVLGEAGLVATVLGRGFDGIYLDRIDVYEEWGPTGKGEKHLEASADAMVSFVRDVAAKARAVRPNALVVAQNATALYTVPALLDVIDAVGLEDVFYKGPRAQPKAHTATVLEHLVPVKARGLPIFSIDYTTRRLQKRYVEKARAAGMVPFPAVSVALDRLPKAH